jgi:hypothetical protein
MQPLRRGRESTFATARRIREAMQSGRFWTSATTDGSRRAATQPQHILIVSRHHPGLFEYVRARFADEENVEVVLDRRRARDRRRRASHTVVERRLAERRVHSQIDTALRMESMQFVTLTPRAIEMRAAAGGATAV